MQLSASNVLICLNVTMLIDHTGSSAFNRDTNQNTVLNSNRSSLDNFEIDALTCMDMTMVCA